MTCFLGDLCTPSGAQFCQLERQSHSSSFHVCTHGSHTLVVCRHQPCKNRLALELQVIMQVDEQQVYSIKHLHCDALIGRRHSDTATKHSSNTLRMSSARPCGRSCNLLYIGSEDQAILEQSKVCAEGLQQAGLGKACWRWPKHLLHI